MKMEIKIKTCNSVTTLKGEKIMLSETMCSYKDVCKIINKLQKKNLNKK